MNRYINYRKYNDSIGTMIGGKGIDDEDTDSTISAGQLVDSDSDTTESIGSKTSSDDPAIATPQGDSAPLDYMDPSHMTYFTIPIGTILYHGSTRVSQFDPIRIDVGGSELAAFFSQNKKFAASYIQECATAPESKGFIHKFEVTRSIDKIYIISSKDKDFAWNEKILKDKFCNNTKFDNINGVGFFVSSGEDDKFSNDDKSSMNASDKLHSSEFALCNPGLFLKYIGTYQCIGPRQLSDEYSFDKTGSTAITS